MASKDKYKFGFISAENSVVLLCDVQEKFGKAITYFPEIVVTAKKVIEAAKILDVPLIVTEQYPKGLGPTVSDLDITHAHRIISKTKFSMMVPDVITVLDEKPISICILLGIEAHVCVEQTAIDLLERGMFVHIVADATSSRTQEDRLLAFQRLQQMGCFITTSECVIFKLLGDKEHPKFNLVKNLVKATSPYTALAQAKI